jgi:hypothetical protein
MSKSPHDPLLDVLLDLCEMEGPLLMDLCQCRQCGATEFHVTPQYRGFEGALCIECGFPGLDQYEVLP